MKIIADDGSEYVPISRNQAWELICKLMPRGKSGAKPGPRTYGHHTITTPTGRFRAAFRKDGKKVHGPCRATQEEATEDFRRMMAGKELEPSTIGMGTEAHREVCRQRHLAWVERARAAAPDGQIHLAPPTCGKCGQVGHRAHCCPAAGWVKKTYERKTDRPYVKRSPAKRTRKSKVCSFCGGAGHIAKSCKQRLEAIAERFRSDA